MTYELEVKHSRNVIWLVPLTPLKQTNKKDNSEIRIKRKNRSVLTKQRNQVQKKNFKVTLKFLKQLNCP